MKVAWAVSGVVVVGGIVWAVVVVVMQLKRRVCGKVCARLEDISETLILVSFSSVIPTKTTPESRKHGDILGLWEFLYQQILIFEQ